MSARAVRGLSLAAVAGVEVYFFARYAANGAQFHYWLHLLLGGYLGVGLLALRRLTRGRRSRVRGWQAGFLGHLYSVVPDVLFLTVGLLHAAWMDVFALHITAHFLWPNALVAGLVLWTLAIGGYVAAVLGTRRTAAAALTASLAFLGLAVALRTPLPSTLDETRRQSESQAALRAMLADPAYLCTAPRALRASTDDEAHHAAD